MADFHGNVSTILTDWFDRDSTGIEPGVLSISTPPFFERYTMKNFDNSSYVPHNTITTFSGQFGALRVIVRNGEPWFVAQDLLNTLGLSNTSEALRALDNDERDTIRIPEGIAGNPERTIISEAGLYTVCLRSRRPEAKAFRRWVTHEVLPELRHSGAYVVARNDDGDSDLIARGLVAAMRQIERRDIEACTLKRKSDALDMLTHADGSYDLHAIFHEAVKLDPGIRFTDVSQCFRDAGMLYKNSMRPTAKAIRMGICVPVNNETFGNSKGRRRIASERARFTAKGMLWCLEALNKEDKQPELANKAH